MSHQTTGYSTVHKYSATSVTCQNSKTPQRPATIDHPWTCFPLAPSTLTAVRLVEAGEGVLDDVLGVRPVQLLPEHGEEHGEVDGPRRLAHHVVQVVVGRVFACSAWQQAGQSLSLLAPQPPITTTNGRGTRPDYHSLLRMGVGFHNILLP